MSKKILQLKQKKADVVAKARGFSDKEELTAEEQTQFDALISEAETIEASIGREEKLAAMGGDPDPAPANSHKDVVISGGEPQIAHDPNRGFKNYGDFCQAVYQAKLSPNGYDERLKIDAALPGNYSNESVGADGGFLIPEGFSSEIDRIAFGQESLLPRTRNININGNSMTFNADETTPWGTGGVKAYWEDEAAQATSSKPSLVPGTQRLNKLIALVPVTEEQLADSGAMTDMLTMATAESIQWKTNDSFINGTGAGKPLGILNSAALVVQAKETGQTAATVVTNNVLKMLSRLPASSVGRSIWLINNEVFPQLAGLTIGNNAAWTFDLSQAPGGMLLGRPVIITQSCKQLGTQGDIVLADFRSYRTITKSSGIKRAVSMHLYFDYDAVAFKAVFRVDGTPSVSKAIQPNNGSTTLSPFVTLAVRA